MTRSVLAVALLALAPSVRAQAGPGPGHDAQPGVHEVPLAVASGEGVRLRGGTSYGWTESVLEMDDSHHRLQLDAALSVTPRPWLSAALRLLGRWDTHAGSSDSDSGVITETHLGARATFPVASAFHAGTQLELWLPAGDEVADALSALSGDLQLLAAYAPRSSPLALGLAIGLRLDRSRYSGGDFDRYSAADRLALGVSDALWAGRLGLALSYRTGALEWVAEWAYRMYFEQPAESPMWLRAGARYWSSPQFHLELLVGASPSKRPSFDDGAPLAVVEPRVWAGLAATYAWTASPPLAAEVRPRPVVKPASAPVALATLRGTVVVAGGAAVGGARLSLERGDEQWEAVADASGAFAFAELAADRYTLRVSAPGFVEREEAIAIATSDPPELTVTLERELPVGQIRGTVRRFNGRPIRATVAIAGLAIAQPTRDDGSFELDVQPGEYSVTVTAPGFRSQTRKARVEQRGVAILIIELEPSR